MRSSEQVLRTDYIIERSKAGSNAWLNDRTQKEGMKPLRRFAGPALMTFISPMVESMQAFIPNEVSAGTNAVVSAGGLSVKQTNGKLGWYTIEVLDPNGVLDGEPPG